MDHPSNARPDTAAIDETIERLDGLLGQMQDALITFLAAREEMRTEVRTRRLVVVDENGFERVVADTLRSSGSVTVRGRTGMTAMLMVDEDSDENTAGLYLSFEGQECVIPVQVWIAGTAENHRIHTDGLARHEVVEHLWRRSYELDRCVRTEALEIVDNDMNRVVGRIQGPHLWLQHPASEAGLIHLGCYSDEAEISMTSNETRDEGPEVGQMSLHVGGVDDDSPGAHLRLVHGGREHRISEIGDET